MKYFRILIWKPEDQAIVELVLDKLFSPGFLEKRKPQKCKWSGKLMTGTQQMTEEIEAKLGELLGKRIQVLTKEPRIWFEAK